LFRSIEDVWLGLSTPPLEERLAAAAWSPDSTEAFCHRCGSSVGPHEARSDGCPACCERKLPWERMVRLGEYRGVLREVIHEIKFTRWRRLGDQVGRQLGRSIGAAVAAAGLDPTRTALVPVPSSFRRRMARGIDHALVICRGIAAETRIEIKPILNRRHGRSQLAVPAGERARNVAGLIRPRRGLDLSGWTLIVVDDVTTTRATLMAACRGVAQCHRLATEGKGRPGPRIWTAVVGVTPSAGHRRAGRERPTERANSG
jgi:predicted amidophosphoribosyltransferase